VIAEEIDSLEVPMHYGIDVPPHDDYANAHMLAKLAHEAEDTGWDRFFIWDSAITN
jgi:hypothetical protein